MQNDPRNFKWKLKKTSPRKNIIIAVTGICLVMLILAAVFFWPKSRDRVIKVAGHKIVVKERLPQPVKPEIAKVKIFPPTPRSVDFLQAEPQLEDKRVKNVSYFYRWFVNGDEVRGLNQSGLPPSYYKRGDVVYCRVTAKQSTYQSGEVESKKLEIENAPPVINSSPVESFQAPGLFRYTIDARDPDGDSLRYRLLTPLNKGIKINPDTGQLEWYIDWIPPVDETGETSEYRETRGAEEGASGVDQADNNEIVSPIVRIDFEVEDSEGAAVIGSITLNLSEGRALAH